MIKRAIAAALVLAAFGGGAGITAASACNRMDGCIHEFQNENYGMMHDGRMDEIMRSGAANVEAFRSPGSAAPPPPENTRPHISGRSGRR